MFPAEFIVALSYERLAKYQPGQIIWVRLDATDHSRVTIDFNRMGGTVSHDADPDNREPVAVERQIV